MQFYQIQSHWSCCCKFFTKLFIIIIIIIKTGPISIKLAISTNLYFDMKYKIWSIILKDPEKLNLKLKTTHKCLFYFSPYKRQSSMLCFIAFKYSQIPVKPRYRKMRQREDYITQTSNILEIHVLVFSLHIILAWFVICFPNAIKHYYMV